MTILNRLIVAKNLKGGPFGIFKHLQSTPVNSYPDNSDLRLIRMYLRPPFREDQSNIIRLIRISHYWYCFIRSPVIRIRRILLYYVPKYQKN